MSSPAGRRDSESAIFLAFLVVTSVLCGGLVMVIEVLGSKVVGPFFGVSLFVWTSLITVTLVALALGYAAGGVLSDRKQDPAYLYGIILVAGCLVLLIPRVKPSILKACMSLGLRGGSLASATLLFGPSLFLLGCVSPYIVRIAAREMTNIGRTVGLFYAVSTLGSFLGTVLTGFVLIAHFRVDQIFEFVGGSLVCLAVAYFVAFRRKPLFLGLLILPWLLLPPPRPREKVQANGTKVSEVFAGDSFYGNLQVLDYTYRNRHMRELAIDGLIQGAVDMSGGLSAYEYPYLLELLPYGINPDGQDCLVLGLGAGIIPMWYEARGIRTDVVDINPAIADIARRFFGFRVSGDLYISDARHHLNTTEKKYDYIIVDVANGDWAPSHLVNLETFRLLRKRLTEKGVVAINLVGSLRQEPFMTASIVKTLAQVFATVKVHPNLDPAGGADPQNVALIAYQDGSLSFDRERVVGFPVHPMVKPLVDAALRREFSFPEGTPAITLSDDYNPIDFFDLRVKEATRRGLLSYTDWDMLI
jgi:spermidine synthase